jgi:hypothetical protein
MTKKTTNPNVEKKKRGRKKSSQTTGINLNGLLCGDDLKDCPIKLFDLKFNDNDYKESLVEDTKSKLPYDLLIFFQFKYPEYLRKARQHKEIRHKF